VRLAEQSSMKRSVRRVLVALAVGGFICCGGILSAQARELPPGDPHLEADESTTPPVQQRRQRPAPVQQERRGERRDDRREERREDRRDERREYGWRMEAPARLAPAPRSYWIDRRPPERYLPRLGPDARRYYWGGSPYYHFEGHWYRPYGSSFVIVGAPLGLFVPMLPPYYTTLWYGGTRYYVADDTYYVFDPMRRGYVVTRSPYGERDDDTPVRGSAPAPELFIYPTRGQSEKQQADDRYECHRWAVDQAHYDPTDAEYRPSDRVEYDRALSACLTGRGYSVK